MKKIIWVALLGLSLVGCSTNTGLLKQNKTEISRSSKILKLDYPGFIVWLDCAQRGAVKFQYVAQRDNGNTKRYDNFFLDPNVPAECQQKTAKAYGMKYDRGHQVPANHLDASDVAIKATNTMPIYCHRRQI